MKFNGIHYRGTGNEENFQLLEIAREMFDVNEFHPGITMLYNTYRNWFNEDIPHPNINKAWY